MRMGCAALILLLSMQPGAAQEPCNTPECIRERMEELRKGLARELCELHSDSVMRHTCMMRETPFSPVCSRKPTAQEQIKCLEEVVEGLMRMLPAIVAEQVKKELAPKLDR
jgi:hypothetical protein